MSRQKKSDEVLAATVAALDPLPPPPAASPIQPSLEGMEEPRHADVSDAALSYANHRDDRMARQKVEKRAYEKLARLMAEHGLDEYSDRSTGVFISREDPEPKFRVKLSAGSESFVVSHGGNEDEAIGDGVMGSPQKDGDETEV